MSLEMVEAEVGRWPGAKISRVEQGRKHGRIYLSYQGRERFVVVSSSPSDSRRGDLNKLRDIRATLAELGAQRQERRKATVRRSRNKQDRPVLANVLPTGPRPDPFAVLSQVTFTEPRKGHLREALRRLAGSVRRMVAWWRSHAPKRRPS